jgi:outer membrane receptor protein involved in Fe transport
MPNVERRVWSGAAIDHAAFGLSTIETRIDARQQNLSLRPDGRGAYLVGHDITRGAYFDTIDRDALSVQAASVFSRASGTHLLKAGVSAGRRELDGAWQSDPVAYLRSSGVPAMRIAFAGPGLYRASSTQVGAFAQDVWQAGDRVTINAGVRLDHQTRFGTMAGPRGGVTWRAGEQTTVSAGAGWYAGDGHLAALAFDQYPSRRITLFDDAGVAVGAPIFYRNVVAADLGYARARTWSAQLDRRFPGGWQLRTAVQERRGTNELVVVPRSGSTAILHIGEIAAKVPGISKETRQVSAPPMLKPVRYTRSGSTRYFAITSSNRSFTNTGSHQLLGRHCGVMTMNGNSGCACKYACGP